MWGGAGRKLSADRASAMRGDGLSGGEGEFVKYMGMGVMSRTDTSCQVEAL